MKTSLCLMLIAVSILTGCSTPSTNVRKHSMKPAPDSATLVGKSALMYLSSTMNDVGFLEIDGAEVPNSFWTGMPTQVPVSPGRHTITLFLYGYGYVSAQQPIEIDCKPKHIYRFAARKIGIAFDLAITEEAPGTKNGEGTEILKTRITGQQGGGAAYIPIFIPTAR